MGDIQRASHVDSIVVVHNVTTPPPLDYYKLLNREPEKDENIIQVGNKICRFKHNKGYIFVTNETFELFPDQFLDLMTPVVIQEKLTKTEYSTTLNIIEFVTMI